MVAQGFELCDIKADKSLMLFKNSNKSGKKSGKLVIPSYYAIVNTLKPSITYEYHLPYSDLILSQLYKVESLEDFTKYITETAREQFEHTIALWDTLVGGYEGSKDTPDGWRRLVGDLIFILQEVEQSTDTEVILDNLYDVKAFTEKIIDLVKKDNRDRGIEENDGN